MGGKKKLMGASWAHRPWFFFWENGRFKKKKTWAENGRFTEILLKCPPQVIGRDQSLEKVTNSIGTSPINFFLRKWASQKKKNHGRMMGGPPMIFFLRKWATQKKKNHGQRPFFGSPIFGRPWPLYPYIVSAEGRVEHQKLNQTAPLGVFSWVFDVQLVGI